MSLSDQNKHPIEAFAEEVLAFKVTITMIAVVSCLPSAQSSPNKHRDLIMWSIILFLTTLLLRQANLPDDFLVAKHILTNSDNVVQHEPSSDTATRYATMLG
jgi:hypothetical protein